MAKQKHMIVVGSGIAGLIAAIKLSAVHKVTLVTKGELAESNTRWAQGGIAAVMSANDSVAEHVEDTLRAGAGLCHREAVEVLCAEGPERIHDLIRLGVPFDRRNGELDRGLEAAHSHSRVLHAGGDATGFSIEMALVDALRAANVCILEHTFARDLLLAEDRVSGLKLIQAGRTQQLEADAVVLASGGAGQLYQHTTNPSCATGDGIAMALRAGAQIADIEFYQFHPTALAGPETFLISEAVRGEGALLLDDQGRRFMQTLHADAELAPRDVVAHGIAMQMAAQNGRPVRLDATMLGAEFLTRRFPSIDAACRRRGFNWAKEPIPVTPAAHYWMGGVRTDLWGQTSVSGLFAVGEVACTGVHGANRLASNSLLESLVFAWRCADRLIEDEAWTRCTDRLAAEGNAHEYLSVAASSSGGSDLHDRQELQHLMWNAVGIERIGEELAKARDQMNRWQVPGEDLRSLETANLLLLAQAMCTAALARCESRGAHFRADYPELSQIWQRSLICERRVAVAC